MERTSGRPNEIPAPIRQLVGSFSNPDTDRMMAADALAQLDMQYRGFVIRACLPATQKEVSAPYADYVIESYLQKQPETLGIMIRYLGITNETGDYIAAKFSQHVGNLKGQEGERILSNLVEYIQKQGKFSNRRLDEDSPRLGDKERSIRYLRILKAVGFSRQDAQEALKVFGRSKDIEIKAKAQELMSGAGITSERQKRKEVSMSTAVRRVQLAIDDESRERALRTTVEEATAKQSSTERLLAYTGELLSSPEDKGLAVDIIREIARRRPEFVIPFLSRVDEFEEKGTLMNMALEERDKVRKAKPFAAKRGLDYLNRGLANQIVLTRDGENVSLGGRVNGMNIVVEVKDKNGDLVGEKVVAVDKFSPGELSAVFDEVRSSSLSLAGELNLEVRELVEQN